MSVTVVGSIAFDYVRTPFGEASRLLGGAATHFALAASFFDRVNVVGCVGEDFTDRDQETLATRGTSVADVERVAGGRTFRWSGEYGWDLNSRTTVDTQLNVLAEFEPKPSPASRDCDVLFLANSQPALQRRVHRLCERARFVALDSMDLWIETARDELVNAIADVDCVILNDAELRQLTATPNLVAAAREVLCWGPTIVVAKQGEYGATLVTEDAYFALPACPLEEVVDPTGAGDTFAGGFLGYLSRRLERGASTETLRQAMAYGTALASFNVEDFGTAGVTRLGAERVHERVAELRRITHFEQAPIELVGAPATP
jgi:sugar/nucleoside kinase (ribokinase family)